MILLVDIGNTRIKWAMYDAGRVGAMEAMAHADLQTVQFGAALRSMPKPERVFIANVSSESVLQLVSNAVQSQWGLHPQLIAPTAAAGGVRNRYVAPEKLGVDRWLGVIAAHRLCKGAACIASIGTAMTIDAVDESGQHLGGSIVPGPDLMISSLMHNTSKIAFHAQGGRDGADLFADNTLGAVRQGVVHALAALIERAVHDVGSRAGAQPALLLTGGASSRIEGALRVPFRTVPDLVLQGMAVLAQG